MWTNDDGLALEVGSPVLARPPPTQAPERSAPPRLSLVVLPFANIGGGPEQEHFVDGITESLTTDLSRIRGSFVIGRNTAFTFKGKAVDLKQIGRELNVRYVREGSVQRGGNRTRVNVQLIDAETGDHLWAERFDKPLGDLFDMQDEIVARLANQSGTELIAAEARRAQEAPIPIRWTSIFRLGVIQPGNTLENMAQARVFFERALELDPNNIDALLGVGRVDANMGASFLSDDRSARLSAAEATIGRVLSRRPDDPLAHEILGGVLHQTKRPTRPLPNSSVHWSWIRTWPLLMAGSASQRFLSAAPERPKLM